MQKRSFCRRSFPHFFRCWKKWGRRRQRKRSRGGRCPGGEQVLRLRARGGFRRCGGESIFPWRGGGLRRPHFFLRRKKCGKESRLDLRSKGPLARGGQVRIWRCALAGGVQRSSLSVKRTVPAFTGAEASATACPSHGRGICFYRVGGVSPPRRRAGVAPAGASCFLFMSKESSQRTPLKERGISNFPLSLRILSP